MFIVDGKIIGMWKWKSLGGATILRQVTVTTEADCFKECEEEAKCLAAEFGML